MSAVTLYLPGWLRLDDLPQGKALCNLLRYADPYPVKEQDPLQRAAFWLHQATPVPVAPVTAKLDLADFDPQAFWVRLEPVHLEPDRDTLVLFPGADIGIEADEAWALIKAFNAHFQQEGVQLEYGAPTRWYVRITQPVDVKTVPLHEAAYANLHHVQPEGSAVRYWNRLINEAQMLFFQHPVNEARRMAGLPEINGLWLWGEGRLPESLKPRPELKVSSDEPFVQGMANLIGAEHDVLLKGLPSLEAGRPYFLHMPLQQGDSTQACAQWQALENELFETLWQQIKNGSVNELLLDFGANTAWHLPRKNLKRFWRRWRKAPSLYA